MELNERFISKKMLTSPEKLLFCLPVIALCLALILPSNAAYLPQSDDDAGDQNSPGEEVTIGPYITEEVTIKPQKPKEKNMAKYLERLGYVELDSGGALGENNFEKVVREYQRFMNINETGKLDEATLAHMQLPRCGNKDFDRAEFIDGRRELLSDQDSSRRRRYALLGNKWPAKLVTYKISKYPTSRRIKRRTVDSEIERAFNAWSKVSPLTFQKRRGKVNIEIKFEKGAHGCKNHPFERPDTDNTLAHAYGPGLANLNGDVHFNDYYTWSVDPAKGQQIYSIAIHEIGHALGMLHSDDDAAIMFPTERNKTQLHRDDIKGIQKIYGRKRSVKKEEEEEGGEPEEEDPELVDAEDPLPDQVEENSGNEDKGDRAKEKEDKKEPREKEDTAKEKPEEEEGTESGGGKKTTTTTTSTTKRPRGRGKSKKPPKCEPGGEWLFPGPTCKQYYDCRHGTPKLKSCRGNLVWSKNEHWCDFPHNVPECRVRY